MGQEHNLSGQMARVFRGIHFKRDYPDDELITYPDTAEEEIDYDDLGRHWTTDRSVADKFATRWTNHGLGGVVEATIPQEHVETATHRSVYEPESEVTLKENPFLVATHIMRAGWKEDPRYIASLEH